MPSLLRTLSSKLHLYLGLLTALLLLPIGLTGSILVFHEEIDVLLYPDLVQVTPRETRVPVDTIVAAVRGTFPETEIARMELPQAPTDPYEAVLQDGARQVYADPYTGKVLGSHRPEETVTGWLFLLHTRLLAGERGEDVVGIVGLVLLALGMTGLVLWWRGRRHVRRGLTVRWRASGRRVNYDLHNALGFYALVPLVVVAFTGAGLIFYGTFSGAAHGLTGTPLPPPPPVPTHRAAGPVASLDHMLAQAQAALPEGRLARVDFPASPEAAYRVRLRMPGELHPIGLSMVYLDPYTGEVLRAESALSVPAARRFGYGFYPLHIGSFGGLGVRILYALVGLVPLVLAVTGTLIWYRRWRGRRRKHRATRLSPPAENGMTRPVQMTSMPVR